MTELRKEELQLLIGELAELVAEDILDADVVSIPPELRVNNSFVPLIRKVLTINTG